jgi:hypothetical protein
MNGADGRSLLTVGYGMMIAVVIMLVLVFLGLLSD